MTNIKQWRSLTQQLRKVLDGLPASSERDESVRSLRELISVLGDLSKALGTLPTAEEAVKAKESLAKLESIVNTNPLLRGRSATNGAKAQVRKRTVASPAEPSHEKEVVEQMVNRLSKMSEAPLLRELENSKTYPNSLLRAMLIHLGRRAPSKGVKSEMVEELVVTIVNRRTYQGIRGEQQSEQT